MQEIPTPVCPVPPEQQPINEYEALKESWPFRWGELAFPRYCRKLAWMAFWGGDVGHSDCCCQLYPPKVPLAIFAL